MLTAVLLVASLGVNAALGGAALAFVQSRGGWAYVKSKWRERTQGITGWEPDTHWRDRTEQFALMAIRPTDTVFLGDSLTEWGNWDELLPELRSRNRGIAGDTVSGVSRRLAEVLIEQPQRLVLLIGINDVLRGGDVDDLIAEQRALIARIREESPATRLIVQSLLPISATNWGKRHDAAIRRVNGALVGITLDAGAEFLDLYPFFAVDGSLNPAFTHDGLHLNGAGYAVWAKALMPVLRLR